MESINSILNEIKDSFVEILKANLTGIYIHGSIAMECFNWNASDIDFLVIVKEELTISNKKKIYEALLEISEEAPPKGLEMSILLRSAIEEFKYPTPYELHFSKPYYEKQKANEASMYAGGLDPDLAGHLVITRERGFCLVGEPIESLFKEPIPKSAYMTSILNDVNDIHEHFKENPTYYILNTCRVLQYIQTEQITSKKESGQWAIEQLPKQYKILIKKALDHYKDNIEAEYDNKELDEYSKYIMREIKCSV